MWNGSGKLLGYILSCIVGRLIQVAWLLTCGRSARGAR